MNKLEWFGMLLAGLAILGEPASTALGQEVAKSSSAPGRYWAYVGTYTGKKSKGIYVCQFDAATGKLGQAVLAAETENPTFLAIHPGLDKGASAGRPILYAANETGWGGKSGSVTAFAVDRESGKLTRLGQASSRGGGPCHLSVDALGKTVLVANYGSGSVAALPIGGDGSLGEATAFVQHAGTGPNKKRQEGPHAHFIQPAPSNKLALACDLGLDQVLLYDLDAGQGTLRPHDPPFAAVKPGAGPRHLAFHPNGRFAYVINELDSTVTAFSFEPEGRLKELQSISTLPEGFTNLTATAEIEAHPSGRFLYGSNRGHDSIAVFEIDPASGRLELKQHQPTGGKAPRHFAIDPSGRWLLAENQNTDNIVVFRIDPATGRLSSAGEEIGVGAPVCLRFLARP